MDNNSYLFMSRRKRLKFSYRVMEKHSSTDSNISLDSLEMNFKEKTKIKDKSSDDNVDTILVPFYENDVLIKVPKEQKRNINPGGKSHKKEKLKKETEQCYLINKVKSKRSTYLEMFRKQFSPNYVEKKTDTTEIGSLSPQFGDTERESIEEDANNTVTDFFNTESYNDMYYEKLLNRDFQAYMDNSLEEVQLIDDLNLESANLGDQCAENFKSISQVSNRHRPARRATVEPVAQNVKLGGLGPDVEQIKPRLERARSLQRYSEKVRMENRLKIYKKTVQADKAKKVETDKRRNSGKEQKEKKDDITTTYLVNKTSNDKNAKFKTVYLKSKSADAQKTKERSTVKEQYQKQRSASKVNESQRADINQKPEIKIETSRRNSGKASSRLRSGSKDKGINTESAEVTPVQISFLVNIGGVRPSSALKTMEEKHRMYQEQVKAFMNDNNKGQ